ncbi:MAG: hypothetical protein M1812_004064 [Candelaria pacifica]|nr:MAG: hypothetical protein M1812_004064 [Candelaria pacifica]
MASRRDQNRQSRASSDKSSDISQSPYQVSDSQAYGTSRRLSFTTASALPHGQMSPHRNPMLPPPQPRQFAAGLALKKPKINEYDPMSMFKPQDEYSFVKDKQDAPLRGTWSTIDPESRKRTWDKLHYEERGVQSEKGFRATLAPGAATPAENSSIAGCGTGGDDKAGNANAHEGLDPRFENPDIDVDPEVRRKFQNIAGVLNERAAPRSAFEQRNQAVLGRKAAAPIKVIIGGKVAKTFVQSADSRGELLDRHGNYIDGINRGSMKKHLEEDRQKMIALRDEEMVRATNEKRAWEAMDPEEQRRTLDKKRKLGGFLGFLGAGAVADDCYEYSEIPDVYVRKVSASSIASWASRSRADSRRDDDWQGVRFESGNEEFGISASKTTPSIRSEGTIKAPRIPSSTATPSSLTTDSTTVSVIEASPELAPLEDSYVEVVTSLEGQVANHFEKARATCTRRGRVVQINLHALVKFSTSAISERVFGGIVQEIQYHPKERVALVIFVFPSEASAFVQHCTAIRENSSQDYRALQMNVEWYHGAEPAAVYPAQNRILSGVMSEEARRVIMVNGIDPLTKKEDLARDISFKLQKILVKVAVLTPSKKYVQKREGNMAVLEFASIKDAVEAFKLFKNRQVSDYTHLTVSWLRDSCDRAVTKRAYCHCLNCIA